MKRPMPKAETPGLASAQSAIPKIRFFAALSLLLAVLQVMGSSGIAKVGRGTGALAPVSRSMPILPISRRSKHDHQRPLRRTWHQQRY